MLIVILSLQYCADETTGEWSKENITSALTTENSVCGPYPIVPCLKDSGMCLAFLLIQCISCDISVSKSLSLTVNNSIFSSYIAFPQFQSNNCISIKSKI